MSARSSRRDVSPERGARPDAARPAPGQIVRNAWPEQWETALEALGRSALTPSESFFVRNHLVTPHLDPVGHRLEIVGLVRTPLRLTLDALRRMPRTRAIVTLECAGNGRARFSRAQEIPGAPWELGAVGTAAWSGVRLAEVLSRAGVREEANHVWLEGADAPLEPGEPKFLRSIPLEKAMDDVLLADAMNDVPLTPIHGAPLRAVVPGWYAMASTKWLTRVSLEGRPCDGYYMKDAYRYVTPGQPAASTPVRDMHVKSVILEPLAGSRVPAGTVHVRGFAWAGPEGVTRVDVSADGGRSWIEATLEPAEPGAWRPWHLALALPAGPAGLMARATDGAGATQPFEAPFNLGGYGNNAIHRVAIEALA